MTARTINAVVSIVKKWGAKKIKVRCWWLLLSPWLLSLLFFRISSDPGSQSRATLRPPSPPRYGVIDGTVRFYFGGVTTFFACRVRSESAYCTHVIPYKGEEIGQLCALRRICARVGTCSIPEMLPGVGTRSLVCLIDPIYTARVTKIK